MNWLTDDGCHAKTGYGIKTAPPQSAALPFFVLFGYKYTTFPLPFCGTFHLDVRTHWVYNKGTNKERPPTPKGENTMKNYPRHRATSPRHVTKTSYEEILVYAKRKYTNMSFTNAYDGQFYIFKTEYQGTTYYEAESIDIFGKAFEHWVKPHGGRWQKQ